LAKQVSFGTKACPYTHGTPNRYESLWQDENLITRTIEGFEFVFGGGLGDAWNFVKVLNFDKVEITRNPTPQSMTITKQKK